MHIKLNSRVCDLIPFLAVFFNLVVKSVVSTLEFVGPPYSPETHDGVYMLETHKDNKSFYRQFSAAISEREASTVIKSFLEPGVAFKDEIAHRIITSDLTTQAIKLTMKIDFHGETPLAIVCLRSRIGHWRIDGSFFWTTHNNTNGFLIAQVVVSKTNLVGDFPEAGFKLNETSESKMLEEFGETMNPKFQHSFIHL